MHVTNDAEIRDRVCEQIIVMMNARASSNGIKSSSTDSVRDVPGQMVGVRSFVGDRRHDAVLLVGVRVGGTASWRCLMLRENSRRLEDVSTAWLRELQ